MVTGVFSIMHYLLPKHGILSLHSGCNIGPAGDVSLFFGLSGDQQQKFNRSAFEMAFI